MKSPAGITVFKLNRSITLMAMCIVFAGALAVSTSWNSTMAQQADPASVAAAVKDRAPNDTRYLIGPGDVLAIIVRKAPELSMEAVRVDQRGMIKIPMIEGEVTAACRTESELASQIASLYLEYKRDPSVDVFVREYQSRPVSVVGAVNSPGQFRLQRQVRLLELLSFAGGPAVRAGRVINIVHTGGPNICDPKSGDSSDVTSALTSYRLYDALQGKEGSNPFVKPGDIVSLPEAEQVYVIGHVIAPQAIPLRDQPITVSRAIAMVGGPARDASTSKVRIIRQAEGSTNKDEILVSLDDIRKRRTPDIVLIPNDVVEVGTSTSKTIVGILTGVAPTAVGQGMVRAIP